MFYKLYSVFCQPPIHTHTQTYTRTVLLILYTIFTHSYTDKQIAGIVGFHVLHCPPPQPQPPLQNDTTQIHHINAS